MYALTLPSWIDILCGNYAAANAHSDEVVALVDGKGTLFWKALGVVPRGLRVGPLRRSVGRGSDDHRWDHRMTINGINTLDAVVLIKLGQSLRETRAIR